MKNVPDCWAECCSASLYFSCLIISAAGLAKIPLLPHQRLNIENLLRDGVLGHTDYSGKRCTETSMEMLLVGLRGAGLKLKRNTFSWWRMTDVSKASQGLGLAALCVKPLHIFADVMDRVPAHHRAALAALRPEPSATRAEKLECYQNQQQYLLEHGSEFLGRFAVAPCLIHKTLCAVSVQEKGSLKMKNTRARRPLLLGVGGSMCTPWSTFGLREGMASHHTEHFQVWLQDLAHSKFDVITLENAPQMPTQLMMDALQGLYTFVHCIFGPNDLGWPCLRKRLMLTAIRKSRLQWVGPTDSVEIAEDFLRCFGASVCVDGSAFFVDALGERALRRDMAVQRGYSASVDVTGIPTPLLLPPGTRSILQELETDLAPDGDWSSADAAIICDLSQSKARRRVNHLLPTLMSSSMLWEAKCDHFVTADEQDLAMGFPVALADGQVFGKDYLQCRAVDLSTLSLAQRRVLAGNGMHLPCVASWHCYVFGNLMWKEEEDLQHTFSAGLETHEVA